ncbi:hypothetical protein M3Y94_00020200 [Aphelenchoides besseyi]|nr:hypothetical protein M3Y94_00020200 [Aphelenchoides besseyi]
MNCEVLVVLLLIALTSADVLDSTGRQTCIDEHNRFRGELARGKVVNEGGESLQKAVDMNELKYNEDLEAKAQDWAKKCKMEHTPDVNYGQNLWESGGKLDQVTALKYAAGSWWSEAKKMSPADLVLTDEVWKKHVGHFTQMAWSHCASVGCAVQVCKETTLVVCNYDQGNMMNAPIYKAGGESCSACDSTRTVCRNDLCAN